MSTTSNRKATALGGLIGASAVVASLFALSVGAGAQDTPAPEVPATAQVAEAGDIPTDAEIIELTEADLNEYHLGTETSEGMVAEAGDIPADAEIIELTEADLNEVTLD